MDYMSIIQFFFDKDVFIKQLQNIRENENQNEHETNLIIRENIMTMLYLLFPTGFPSQENIHNSYDILTMNESNHILSGISKIFKPVDYSYLKINGSIYTTSRVVWLNDLFNEPNFTNLLELYDIFKKKMIHMRISNDIFSIELNDPQNPYLNMKYPEYVRFFRELKNINTSNIFLHLFSFKTPNFYIVYTLEDLKPHLLV